MTKIVNDLATKVQNAIMASEAFKEGWNIGVIEKNGVITLRGEVPAKKYMELAESIAKEQEGVISVINEMDINASLQENPDELEPDEDIQLPPRRQRPYGKH